MSDPIEIYLQPECCADPDMGRLWCEHDAPVDCDDGKPWTKYVLAARLADAERLLREASRRLEEVMEGFTDDLGDISLTAENIGVFLRAADSAIPTRCPDCGKYRETCDPETCSAVTADEVQK